MKIEAKWQNGMHFTSSAPTGHTISIDSGPAGAVTAGPSPMEITLQAAAVCSGMDVVAILEKKRKTPELLEIEVEGSRTENHPKVFKSVNLLYKFKGDNLKEKDVEQAVRLSVEKYCSVLIMISKTAEITWNYELLN